MYRSCLQVCSAGPKALMFLLSAALHLHHWIVLSKEAMKEHDIYTIYLILVIEGIEKQTA